MGLSILPHSSAVLTFLRDKSRAPFRTGARTSSASASGTGKGRERTWSFLRHSELSDAPRSGNEIRGNVRIESANHAGGISGHDAVGRDIRGHDCARTNDRAFTNRHSRQHAGIESDPDISLNVNRARRHHSTRQPRVSGRQLFEFLAAAEEASHFPLAETRQEFLVRSHSALGIIAWNEHQYTEAMGWLTMAEEEQTRAGGNWERDLTANRKRLEGIIGAPQAR